MVALERDGGTENMTLTMEQKIAIVQRRRNFLNRRRNNPSNPRDMFWTWAEAEALDSALAAMEMLGQVDETLEEAEAWGNK